MKPALAIRDAVDDLHSTWALASAPDPQSGRLHGVLTAAPALTYPHKLSSAIDVVGLLTEQAWTHSEKGAYERAIFEAFSSTFSFMVEYLHCLKIDQLEPSDAWAKASTAARELTAQDMDFLRAVCVRRNSGR